jgi:hypothetical protein
MNRLSPNTGFIFIFLILLIFSSDLINSQTNVEEEINNQFDKAVSLFNTGNYDDALQIFNKFWLSIGESEGAAMQEVYFFARGSLILRVTEGAAKRSR